MTPLDLGPLEAGLALLLALNLATYFAFAFDKRRARLKGQRIAEKTLLWMALAGGTPGAYAGRRRSRHKTRKQPFVGRLHTIAALQVAAMVGAGYWLLAI